MKKSTLDIGKLHEIVEKTILILYRSKGDLHKIIDDTKIIFNELEVEYNALKTKVHLIITDISLMENNLAKSRQSLDIIHSASGKHSPEEIRKAHEEANALRVQLVLKRNEEQILIKKRNDLEVQLRDTLKTLNKADKVIENLNVSLDLMTKSLEDLSKQIEDIQISQKIGIKIIKAQEDERRKVARELHDSPAQVLSNILMKAEICDKLMDKDISSAKKEIINLKKTINACLEDVQRIAYNLRPLSLTEDGGLVHTLENYISEFSRENNIEVLFNNKLTMPIEGEELSLTIFRIVQECLNNVKKHSGAAKATVYISNSASSFDILIADNGKGFNLDDVKNASIEYSHGFGLVSMRERLKLINGAMEVITAKGQGSKFIIKIPSQQNTDTKGKVLTFS